MTEARPIQPGSRRLGRRVERQSSGVVRSIIHVFDTQHHRTRHSILSKACHSARLDHTQQVPCLLHRQQHMQNHTARGDRDSNFFGDQEGHFGNGHPDVVQCLLCVHLDRPRHREREHPSSISRAWRRCSCRSVRRGARYRLRCRHGARSETWCR